MQLSDWDQLYRNMFLARKVTIAGGVGLLGLFAFLLIIEPLQWHRQIGFMMENLWVIGSSILLMVTLAAALTTCYYTYYVARPEGGFLYAAGHALLCFALIPVILAGPVLIPILVSNDIERWRNPEQDESTPERQ